MDEISFDVIGNQNTCVQQFSYDFEYLLSMVNKS